MGPWDMGAPSDYMARAASQGLVPWYLTSHSSSPSYLGRDAQHPLSSDQGTSQHLALAHSQNQAAEGLALTKGWCLNSESLWWVSMHWSFYFIVKKFIHGLPHG